MGLMPLRVSISLSLCAVVLAGCINPPTGTADVSRSPADAKSFAVARKAVEACAKMPDRKRVLNAFRTFGFQVAEEKIALRNGRETTRRVIQAPNPAVSVLFHGSTCVVGLESMTPEQSNQLARTWVLAYEAQPNSRLAKIVSGAWRSFFTESAQLPVRPALTHRIYIAAYKTWPSGPYDPQRNVPFNIDGLFPDKPGAAVRLTYVIDCDPLVKTDANTTLLLSCDPAGGTGEYYEIKTR